jgi:hypothetical protein
LALLAKNFISQRKPLAFGIGIKTPLKQPHPHFWTFAGTSFTAHITQKRHTIPYD